jgi:IS5 family transposase
MMDSRPKRKLSNQTHRSRTDPDATLAQKKGSPRQLKYKVHQSIDAGSRVILDTHVTTGARHDNQPYLDQLRRIRDRYKLTICEAIADRGYGSAAIIRTLQQQGIKAHLPLWSGRVGKSKHWDAGLIYEREEDRVRCPEGNYLTPNPSLYENYKRYVSSPKDCQACSKSSTCTAKRKKSTLHQRFVLRSLDQDLFEEVQARMRDPTFRQKMSERMWKCEGLFAEAKQNHGLARARYRGRRKVQIQAYLSATAQNLKRLVFLFYWWLISWWSRDHKTRT